MKAVLIAAIVVASLTACSTTRPVDGRMEKSDESFRGSITGSGYREGTGELTLLSSHRATCRGSFVYTSRRRGEGTLTCDDGRSGSFHVASIGESGSGVGELAGQRFTFTIGHS